MKTLLLLAGFLLSSPAFADTVNESVQVQSSSIYQIPDTGYRLYGSVGGGGGALLGNSSDFKGSGEDFLLSFNLGRRTRHWELDTGLGWEYLHRSRVRIRSGRLEASPRYRVGAGWQVGPLFTLNFGTDTGVDTVDRQTGRSTLSGGVKTTYDLAHLGSFPVQAWAELVTALTSRRHDEFTALLGVRIGLPVSFEGKPDALQASGIADSITAANAAPRRDIRLNLGTERGFFGTASSHLNPDLSRALQGAGAMLAQDRDAYVQVDGHADIRGSKALNDRLSFERAESARKILVQNGMLNEQVHTRGYGYSVPLDPANTPEAWALNRRLEMTFKNVKDPDALLKALSPIDQKSDQKKTELP